MLRLDYSGHGTSEGVFEAGTIGQWAEDARLVIADRVCGRMILVGSSMGGWIGVLLARHFGARVAGFIGIAAAPDFTETLMWQAMAPAEQAALMREGQIGVPSEYGPPLVITRALIEDGRRHLVLGGRIGIDAPVRLLQGQRDPDVPWETALKLAAAITGDDVRVTLIKDGDHRLSRPGDLDLLTEALAPLLGQDGGEA
jgi:pimeloyl-ACP methyl ester carboxylesterase